MLFQLSIKESEIRTLNVIIVIPISFFGSIRFEKESKDFGTILFNEYFRLVRCKIIYCHSP
jgi:hypothetical protein